MKLLDVKPVAQWEDQSHWHDRMGIHGYEDAGQELDPYFHLLAEVERKEFEKHLVRQWRKGNEVRF